MSLSQYGFVIIIVVVNTTVRCRMGSISIRISISIIIVIGRRRCFVSNKKRGRSPWSKVSALGLGNRYFDRTNEFIRRWVVRQSLALILDPLQNLQKLRSDRNQSCIR